MGTPIPHPTQVSRTSRPNHLGHYLSAASITAVATLFLFMKIGLDAESSTAPPAILSDISYDQTNHSVSIILHLDDHRPFTLGKLDSGLYVDIENTRVLPELLARGRHLSGNSLIQVRARQFDKDTARVVFHFDAIARLQAVPLLDPSRILVEIEFPDPPTDADDLPSMSAISPSPNIS